MSEGEEERRSNYLHMLEIPTRWMDNDVYGHVNNVVYYSYFDTVINSFLIKSGGLDIHTGAVIGIAVESQCRFHRSLAFPDQVDAGLRVGRLGNTSVRYEVGLFRQGDESPAATGHFVHVFVDREQRRPTPIPTALRSALERLAATRAVG
jgi:acyl-CoA thioester hydrolase